MQLSKATVLDNYKAVNINVVNGHGCGSMSIHVFLHSNLHSNPLCVSLVEVMLGAISSEQSFEQHICSGNHVKTDSMRLKNRPNGFLLNLKKSP